MVQSGSITRALGMDEPEPDLDPYLDAAARCFERYGLRRTSVPDVARELGVSRATVYRRAGSVDGLARMLLAREVRRALQGAEALLQPDPDLVVDVVSAIVTYARNNGVLAKLARDEPEIVGTMLVAEFRGVLEVVVPFMAPLIGTSMRRGKLAARDAAIVAEWLVRLTVSLVIAPPLSDVRAFLREVVLPVLAPEANHRSSR